MAGETGEAAAFAADHKGDGIGDVHQGTTDGGWNRWQRTREAARLKSFPDSFVFEGTKMDIARQIGNAVPPALAREIALHLACILR